MIFRDDNGNVLETVGEFAMTKQSITLFNSQIRGDVSINFIVDSNSETRKTLGYYGPQMTNQIAFVKQPFNRLDHSGNLLDRGYIVIQDDNVDSLNCFYVSGNANWFNAISGLITELDFTGKTNGVNYSEAMSDFLMFSTVGRTSGVTIPLADWACNFRRGNNYYGSITDSSGNGFLNTFPVFFLKTLVEEIFKQNRIKVSGNILTDPLYSTLAIGSQQGTIERPFGINTYGFGTYQAISSSFATYTNITTETDPLGQLNLNGIGNLFTSVTDALVFIYVQVTCVEPTTVRVLTTGGGFTDYVIPGNTDIYGPGHILIPGNTGQTYSLDGYTATIGYTLDIQVKANTATTPNFRIDQILFQTPKNNTGSDFFLPNYFLPEISCMDVIKYVISSFGCSVYFSDVSNTISINIIDKIKKEDALDWSEYYVSHRSEYTVVSAKNNYLRLADPDDNNIQSYNKANSVKYGEANIESANTLKETNDVFKAPFTASETDLGKNGIYQTSVPLINLTDEGGGIAFTSISSSGGLARYTAAAGTFSPIGGNEICRIVSGGIDLGYFVVIATAGAGATITFNRHYFTTTNTGKIYRQKAISQKLTPRIGVVIPTIPLSSISSVSEIYVGIYTMTSVPFFYFTKPKTNRAVDQVKSNAAYDNPNDTLFTDPTIKELYFNKISNILNNPTIRIQMLLPVGVYKSFDFSQFIYIKTPDLVGYFFVDSIVNYIDGKTPVEVNVYML